MDPKNPVLNQPPAPVAPAPPAPPITPPLTPPPSAYEPTKPRLRLSVIISSVVVALLLLAIPIAVYLTQHQQNIKSKADVPIPAPPKNALILVKDSNSQQDASPAGNLTVKVYVKADVDAVNVIHAAINYPSDKLEIVNIATASAKLNRGEAKIDGYYLESNFDNYSGLADITEGIPNPGFKTETTDKTKYLLATIQFKVKSLGGVDITFNTDKSGMYRNSDTLNVLSQKENLSLKFLNLSDLSLKSASTSAGEPVVPTAQIKLQSPLGGEVLSYFDPIEVKWDSKNLDQVTISLIVNQDFFGNLSTNLTNTGSFTWKPSVSLPLTYINPNTGFRIKVSGKTKEGLEVADISPGYFGLVSQTDAKIITKPTLEIERSRADINNDNKIDFADLSLLLANFNKQKFEPSYDFNLDGGVNIIDLWLMRSVLINQEVIK